MNAVQNIKQNCYSSIKGVTVYLDYCNSRLKILDYQSISDKIIKHIVDFAENRGLNKVISNCRIQFLNPFRNNGFIVEGTVKGYFQGENAYCISYFVDPQRRVSPHKEAEDALLYHCISDPKRFSPQAKPRFTIRKADLGDIPEMIEVFSTVFATYPTPVFSREYLAKVMNDQVLFKVAEEEGQIASIASADMDQVNLNAEITDCATQPAHRGRNILPYLIRSLETDLKEKGFHTAYSLSRAVNPGINKAFSRLEYQYGGRLINNCHICGGFEDMNIWSKNLAGSHLL